LKLKQVKEALRLNDETLRCYVTKYREGSVKVLITTNYPGSQLRASRRIARGIGNQYPFTSNSVVDYVQSVFGVSYSVKGREEDGI